MRVYVVNDEKDLGELTRRVLRAGVGGARGTAVEENIRAANPHVDFERLRPGAVLLVPDDPDVVAAAPATGGLDPAQLAAALPRVVETVQRGREAADQRAEKLNGALRAPEVRRAGDADDGLSAELARLAELVAAEQRRAEQWEADVSSHVEHWKAALDQLGQL